MSKKPTYEELAQKVKALEKTESDLRESAAFYRSLFENAPVGIGIADADGNIIDFNAAILKPGGYTPEDIAGIKNLKKLYADQKVRSRIVARLNRFGHVDKAEVQFKRKDGHLYDCLLSIRHPVPRQLCRMRQNLKKLRKCSGRAGSSFCPW